MFQSISRSLLAAGVLFSADLVSADPATAVGMVVTRHAVRIDSTPVEGKATVLSGHLLEPTGGTGELRLRKGSVLMAANSRVRAYDNRAELQAGKIQMSGTQISATAGGIQVQAGRGGQAIVDRMNGRIVVGALRGSVDVKDKAGTLVARLEEGHALAFDEGGRRSAAAISSADKAAIGQGSPGSSAGGAFMSTAGKVALGFGLSAAAATVPTAVLALREDSAAISR